MVFARNVGGDSRRCLRGLFDGQAVIEKLGRTNFYASPELLAAVSEKLTNITASGS
jgi:hypothetical protein